MDYPIDVIQLNTDTQDTILEDVSSYTPVTNYWKLVVMMVNMMLLLEMAKGSTKVTLKKEMRTHIEKLPLDTPEQWAEMVMSINHVLWILSAGELESREDIEQTRRALHDLYYEYHDLACKTLKGDALSTYLNITD